MRDQGIWSISLGRWGGVQVRLHMFFLVFAAFTIYLGWVDASSAASEGHVALGVICVVVLLCSVIAHELAHVFVGNRLGASVDEIVLGPLGGLGPMPEPLDPKGEVLTAVAGPVSNLALCLISALALLIHGGVNLVGLLHPFAPQQILEGSALLVGLKLAFWINWLLLLLNLIPAFPFDAARALRSEIMVVAPRTGPQKAVAIVARVAKLTAVGLFVLALFNVGSNPGYPVQTWFALILLSIFVYFSAKREEALVQAGTPDATQLGYDFSAGYTSLEQSGSQCSTKPAMGPLVRWWDRRQDRRLQRRREVEAIEDDRVDNILVQVHASGIDSLSSEDRKLLQRVSSRYRDRVR